MPVRCPLSLSLLTAADMTTNTPGGCCCSASTAWRQPPPPPSSQGAGGKAVPPPAPASEAEALGAAITAKGNQIRDLKAAKASKDALKVRPRLIHATRRTSRTLVGLSSWGLPLAGGCAVWCWVLLLLPAPRGRAAGSQDQVQGAHRR